MRSFKETMQLIGISLIWPFVFIPIVLYLIFGKKSASGDGELGLAMIAAWPIVLIGICYEDIKRAIKEPLDNKSKKT